MTCCMLSSWIVVVVATISIAPCNCADGFSKLSHLSDAAEVVFSNGSAAADGLDMIAMLQHGATVLPSSRGTASRGVSMLSTQQVEGRSDAAWLDAPAASQAARLGSSTGDIWPGPALATSLSTIRSLMDRSLLANEKAEIAARAYTLAKARADAYAREAQKAADVVVAKSGDAIENSEDTVTAATHLKAPSTEVVLPSSAQNASEAAEKAESAAENVSDAITAYKAAEKEAKADSLVMLSVARSIVVDLNETIQQSGAAAASLGHIFEATPIPPLTTTTAATLASTTSAVVHQRTLERQQPRSSWNVTTIVILSVVAAVLLGLACWVYNQPLGR